MSQFDEQTTLNVPLRFGETPLGILRFYVYGHERVFSADEIELARGLGEQAATAVWNARQYARVERARRRTDALLDAARALTTTVDLDEVVWRIVRKACEVLGVSAAALYEHDAQRDLFCYRALFEPVVSAGLDDGIGTWYPLSEHAGERAIFESDDVVLEYISDPDLPADRRKNMEEWNEKTCLNVPLRLGDNRLGALRFYDYENERRFSDDELDLARGLGEQAAIAFGNARLYDRVERARLRTDTLLKASGTLTSTLVREEVLALVTRRAAEALGAPRCDLYEYDAAADTLTLRGYHEDVPSEEYAKVGEALPLDDRPGDREILRKGEIVVESVSDPATDPTTRAEMERWGELTCLNVPLIVKGEPLGILIITETEHERVYTPDEFELARGLGEQVGLALQNSRLFSRLETQNRRLLDLLQSSREMTGAMDVEKAVETMCGEIAGLLDCPVCHIDVGLRNESGEFVPPVALAADEEMAINAQPAMQPDELTRQALTRRSPQQLELGDAGRRLVIPLFAKDEPSGFVDLSGPAGTRFGDDEIEVVQILVNQAAVAIDNALLLQDRERRAVTDGLTGLFNHRHFYDRLHSEMARSLRYFTPLSLLILDVDDFKTFNDAYGHQAGDEALRALGRVMLSGIRQHVDIPCRYGGEEFAVILPNTPAPAARVAGERLHEEIGRIAESLRVEAGVIEPNDEGLPVPVPNPQGAAIVGERIRQEIEHAQFVDGAGSPLRRVTVSIGVAAFPEHAVNADELVAAADKALYEAKRAGKNRVKVCVDKVEGAGGGDESPPAPRP